MVMNFQEWIDQNFPTKDRIQMMIVKADNILTPESLQKMFHLHQAVQNISVEDKTFTNICTKYIMETKNGHHLILFSELQLRTYFKAQKDVERER